MYPDTARRYPIADGLRFQGKPLGRLIYRKEFATRGRSRSLLACRRKEFETHASSFARRVLTSMNFSIVSGLNMIRPPIFTNSIRRCVVHERNVIGLMPSMAATLVTFRNLADILLLVGID
jgi:hypothetical protein